jgi:hypothetical protein
MTKSINFLGQQFPPSAPNLLRGGTTSKRISAQVGLQIGTDVQND